MDSQRGRGNFSSGMVDDWSHHRVIFSDPGMEQDAFLNGRHEKWQSIVNNPRYRMQQFRRSMQRSRQRSLFDDQNTLVRTDSSASPEGGLPGDWTVNIAPTGTTTTASPGMAADTYPAKYTFNLTAAPTCAGTGTPGDYVVFPVNQAGSTTQANLVAFDNLYSGTCSGTVPGVYFAYRVGSGKVQTSPALSLDGTKVAFVESVSGASIFHVLTLGTTGSNGTAFNLPVTPGTGNNAVDTRIALSGGVMVTRSSPFIEYGTDTAYVGDDTGKLHKITPVFNGTPAEVTTGGWPVTVASGVILSPPVFDGGVSNNILVGGSTGFLYCLTSAGVACSTPSVQVGTGPILDAPTIDISSEMVYTEANNGANAIAFQATTSLGTPVSVNMGSSGTDLYNGTPDNAYFNSPSTGHMYFCGNLAGSATPTLYRVGFTGNTMNSARDASSFQLVSGSTGTGVDCAPLVEFDNPNIGIDLLAVSVLNFGSQANCNSNSCLMIFNITSSFPTTPVIAGSLIAGGAQLPAGTSGIVIDNVSGSAGASQFYFGFQLFGLGIQDPQAAGEP
jgi:hypothetical protein